MKHVCYINVSKGTQRTKSFLFLAVIRSFKIYFTVFTMCETVVPKCMHLSHILGSSKHSSLSLRESNPVSLFILIYTLRYDKQVQRASILRLTSVL